VHDGLVSHANSHATVAACPMTFDGLVLALLAVSVLSHAAVLIVVVLLAASALRTHVN
jgi:hypothetical protein